MEHDEGPTSSERFSRFFQLSDLNFGKIPITSNQLEQLRHSTNVIYYNKGDRIVPFDADGKRCILILAEGSVGEEEAAAARGSKGSRVVTGPSIGLLGAAKPTPTRISREGDVVGCDNLLWAAETTRTVVEKDASSETDILGRGGNGGDSLGGAAATRLTALGGKSGDSLGTSSGGAAATRLTALGGNGGDSLGGAAATRLTALSDVKAWRLSCDDVLDIMEPQRLSEYIRVFKVYASIKNEEGTYRMIPTKYLKTSLLHGSSGLTVEELRSRSMRRRQGDDQASSSSSASAPTTISKETDSPNTSPSSVTSPPLLPPSRRLLRRKYPSETLRLQLQAELKHIVTPLPPSHVALLDRMTRKNRDGHVSFQEFLRVNRLISGRGAHYEVAFRIFDHEKTGSVSLDDVRAQMTSTRRKRALGIPEDFRFDFQCSLIAQYFGNRGDKALEFNEFAQFFVHLQREIARQHFNYFDADNDGTISQHDFVSLALSKTFRTEMPPYVQRRVYSLFSEHRIRGDRISYAEFSAFNDFLRHLPAIETAILAQMVVSGRDTLTRDELVNGELKQVRDHIKNFLSPMEIDLVWDVYDLSKSGYIKRSDVEDLMGCDIHEALEGRTVNGYAPNLSVQLFPHRRRSSAASDAVDDKAEGGKRSVFGAFLHFCTNFALGGVAGGIGVSCVYPIDLVKTRMQNQRTGAAMYRNSFECFYKVLTTEGFRGLYRGIVPQLMGVSPEKAIKLAVNDFLRGQFSQKQKGSGKEIIHPALEILAGMGAGASQVVFTNPVEIVKIRLQTAALLEAAESGKNAVPKRTGLTIVKDLGFRGLYKGSAACFLRDIPFSAIYFPCYAFCKKALSFEKPDGTTDISYHRLLLSGALAGIPAAYLCTPADVIKTRLQAEAKAGGTNARAYNGLRDAAVTIFREEGFSAFFKGGMARVCRSSPQFGITLLAYEMLHKFVAPEKTHFDPPTNAPLSENDRRVVETYQTLSTTMGQNIKRLGRVDAF
eukprot:g3979.t1